MAEGKLREVEEDAIYITQKRFADQREEAERTRLKLEREAAKTKPSEESDKKGK